MHLLDFINSPMRNAWVRTPYIRAYVRKSKRTINGYFTLCLDLANVTSSRRGYFRPFMVLFEREAFSRYWTVYIENVHSDRLRDILIKHDYMSIEGNCWYKVADIRLLPNLQNRTKIDA